MDVRSRGSAATLALSGELDLREAKRVAEVWRTLCSHDELSCIVLDLRGLELIDSSGLATILHVHGDCRRQNRELLIVRPRPSVMHRFDATGITEHLTLVDDAP